MLSSAVPVNCRVPWKWRSMRTWTKASMSPLKPSRRWRKRFPLVAVNARRAQVCRLRSPWLLLREKLLLPRLKRSCSLNSRIRNSNNASPKLSLRSRLFRQRERGKVSHLSAPRLLPLMSGTRASSTKTWTCSISHHRERICNRTSSLLLSVIRVTKSQLRTQSKRLLLMMLTLFWASRRWTVTNRLLLIANSIWVRCPMGHNSNLTKRRRMKMRL